MVDNLSVNSGLVSDNYTGFNTSTIEQISVLTGGYNAEYGEGRSAVVNIISKEAPKGIHGTLITRMRPAGVYHFGRNMYSTENNDYKNAGIDYWTQQSQDENSRFYLKNPDSLLNAWRSRLHLMMLWVSMLNDQNMNMKAFLWFTNRRFKFSCFRQIQTGRWNISSGNTIQSGI